jgi:malic enzyme
MGLGLVASGARRVTDGMFTAAAAALGKQAPVHHKHVDELRQELLRMPVISEVAVTVEDDHP